MKKRSHHILFWIGYWLLLSYFEWLWMQDYITGWPVQKMVLRAMAGAFFFGIPQVLLAYYITYYALSRIIQKKKGVLVNAALILLPYVAAICLIILVARQLVLPWVYEGIVTPKQAFFDPNKFFTIMIEAAFPAGLLMAIRFVNMELAAREREKNLLSEKLTAELQLLKSQLNPHFLFNTLNNIYALTRKKSDLAPEAVMKLSELLSFMLYEAGNDTIPVEKEIKFLEDYISIQKIRYADNLSLVFHKDIDMLSQPIAPLLLLPLVENAFKHGAGENHFDSFIHIDLKVKKGRLYCLVKNSFEPGNKQEQPKNIGLSNIRRQLELMYKEQRLETNCDHQVFTVNLSVNLNSYGKI